MEASVNKERCAVQACTLNNLAKLQYKVHETHLNNTCNKPENDPNKGKVEEKAKAGEKTESLWTLTLSLTLIGGGGEDRKPLDPNPKPNPNRRRGRSQKASRLCTLH